MKHLTLKPSSSGPPTRDTPSIPASLPDAEETKLHPTNAPDASTNASFFFVGTATTIIERAGLRILTDPNFLHAGDHVHLGPGVSALLGDDGVGCRWESRTSRTRFSAPCPRRIAGWLSLGIRFRENYASFENGCRIYVSGDTLMVDQLQQIPERYRDRNIDLMLVLLGGTTIPGPSTPLLMMTMYPKQGVQLMQLVNPDLTIPIHYDDYDVFLSPLDFKKAVHAAGLNSKVVYPDRKDQFKFSVRQKK